MEGEGWGKEDQKAEWLSTQAYFLDLRKSLDFFMVGKMYICGYEGSAALSSLTQELSLIGQGPGDEVVPEETGHWT